MHADLLRGAAIGADEQVDGARGDAQFRTGGPDLDERAEGRAGQVVDGDAVVQRCRVLEQQIGTGLHAYRAVVDARLEEIEIHCEVDIARAHEHDRAELVEFDEGGIPQRAGRQQFAQV